MLDSSKQSRAAATDFAQQQISSATRRIGEFEVTAISDGTLQASADVILGLSADELDALVGGASDPFRLSVNCWLIRHRQKTILVDAGGGSMVPTLGRLPDHLRAAGTPPEAIGTILLTHLHSDHANGLVDAEERAVFPNAELVMHQKEAVFWLDRRVTPQDSDRLRRNTLGAQRVTAPYRDRIRRIDDGEVLPGISAVLLAGHTPGHTGWLLESGGERLLIWGDIVHLAGVQIPRPDAALVFDVDPDAAVAARHHAFEWTARERLLVAGAHLDFPGFGYMLRQREGYRFQADV
jgi:glyoxylase-like metal-dependent hydrolase (beta-lactamase superfamily II)